ncbi:hypothetical protein [Lonsdalea populi]|uniref:hypothetical protein n=1 Tax=Lonsdalea populi TaxID=1172565 RepID=UPI00159398A5|nr:hypothetical protein [Lonsdalea populi]QPQ23343.1 hypothetical protein I6N93_11855 [Lonsdalea populi]
MKKKNGRREGAPVMLVIQLLSNQRTASLPTFLGRGSMADRSNHAAAFFVMQLGRF